MVKDARSNDRGPGMNWRERNMAARGKQPGESQVAADTRRSDQRVQRGMFVPHSVRVAELKRKGYSAKDADRVADFQSSSMGQDMLSGTTMSAVASDYTGELAQQKFREQFGRAPEALRYGGNGKGAGQPGTNVGAAFEQPAGVPPVFQGEANAFKLKGKTREERMAHAKTLARPDGKEGTYYDQLAQERRTQDALADAARQQKEKEPKKPEFNSEASGSVQMPDGSMREIKSGDSEQGTATFTMPDGTVRKIGANESPSRVIDLAKKEAGIEAKSPPPNPEEMKRQQEVDRIMANSPFGGKKKEAASEKAEQTSFEKPSTKSARTDPAQAATPITPPKPKEVAFAQPGKSDTGGKVSSARAKLKGSGSQLNFSSEAGKQKFWNSELGTEIGDLISSINGNKPVVGSEKEALRLILNEPGYPAKLKREARQILASLK